MQSMFRNLQLQEPIPSPHEASKDNNRALGIHIGIYVGSSSASVAFRRGELQPHLVRFKDGRTTVPLRVSGICDEAGYTWGDGVNSSLGTNNLFGITIGPKYTSLVFFHHLKEKRGSYAHSFVHGTEMEMDGATVDISPATDQFRQFLGGMESHVFQRLKEVFGREALQESVSTYVVLPPHLTKEQVESLKDSFGSATLFKNYPRTFINHQQAVSMYYMQKTGYMLRRRGILVVCNMEEEITTLQWMKVFENAVIAPSKNIPPTRILTVGLKDIGERFQNCIEEQLRTTAASLPISQLRCTGEELAVELQNIAADFLSHISSQSGGAVEIEVQSGSVNASKTRVFVSDNAIRARIFNPILQHIIQEIRSCLKDISEEDNGTRCVLLSGPLGECPYAKGFIRRRLEGIASTLNTSDESTTACQGATLWDTPLPLIRGEFHDTNRIVIEKQPCNSRLEDLAAWAEGLKNSDRDPELLVRDYDMILWEQIQRCSFDSKSVRTTFHGLRDLYHRHVARNPPLRSLSSRKTALGVSLAAALGDSLAVQTILMDFVHQQRKNDFHLDQALFLAASYGREEALATLLHCGADVNGYRDVCGLGTALQAAVKSQNLFLVKHLLDKGAEQDHYGEEGSALHIAANSGSIPLVQLLLDHGFDVEFESSSRRGVCHETPLGAAALNGQKDVVQCLLKRGADINRQVCHYQFTPIRNAARVGNTKAIKLLLDFGADPYAGPYSALHDAAFYGHYEAVKALVDSGIDVNYRSHSDLADSNSVTPLESAIYVDHCLQKGPHYANIIRLLLERGAKTTNGLHWWATLKDWTLGCADNILHVLGPGDKDNFEAIFHILLARGEDVNGRDEDGNTPLHRAVTAAGFNPWSQGMHDPMPHIRILVSHGANVRLLDFNSKTPLDLVTERLAECWQVVANPPSHWTDSNITSAKANVNILATVENELVHLEQASSKKY